MTFAPLRFSLLLWLAMTPALLVQAEEAVKIIHSCVEQGLEIVIGFKNEDSPQEDDWIGLYPVMELDENFEPIVWHWTCGDQECNNAMSQGTVFFKADDNFENWPLPTGRYQAVLAKMVGDTDEDYEFRAFSNELQIVSNMKECTFDNFDFNLGDNVGQDDDEPSVDTVFDDDSNNNNNNGDDGVDPDTDNPPPSFRPTSAPSFRRTSTPRADTDSPTFVPTIAPSFRGTPRPTPSPTRAPNDPSPTASTSGGGTSRMSQVIADATQDIIELIQQTPVLRALWLRQIFHDCVGGACDGCINTDNIDNGGLQFSMDVLSDLEEKYQDDLSRADLWVLASFVGVEQAMPGAGEGDSIAMPFKHFGREDCGDRMTRGPDPELCSANLGTDGMLRFFADEFDFSPREVAAIMGGHTIGIARRNILGFHAPNGWVPNNTRFDNQYYEELVGTGSTVSQQVENAPQWRLERVNNTDIGLPDRFQWVGFPGGKQVTMLNSDIALVRQLDDTNKEDSGFVSCGFVSRDPTQSITCPVASSGDIFSHMVRYRNDNGAFLQDFRDAMVKMTNVGYSVDESTCDDDGICRLVRNGGQSTVSRGGEN